MKFLFIGTEPQTVEGVWKAVCLRWPEATVLVVRGPDDGLQVMAQEEPDVVIYQLSLDHKSLEIIGELQGVAPVPMIVAGPTLPSGSPAFMQWLSGFPSHLPIT